MKKLLLLLLFIPCIAFGAGATSATTISLTPDSGIFSILKEVNKDKATLSEKESAIKYEENNIQENKSKIEELETLTSQLKEIEEGIATVKKFYTGSVDITENKDYQEKVKSFDSTLNELLAIVTLPADLEPLTFTGYAGKKYEVTRKIQKKTKELNSSITASEKTIATAQEELKILNEEVKKSETTFQNEVRDLATKISIFIAALTFIVFLGKALKKFIKSRPYLGEEKREVFLLIVRWLRNTTIVIITFLFFFSEFVSILPFLAIVGTALGLALRDVISSFIAWFIIGLKDSIYKVSDIVEIENKKIFGRVIKITPLITVVQELGMNGPDGIYLSFPNKEIFDSSVKNYSKMNNWTYITADFFLDATSDISIAREQLKKIMTEVITQESFRSATSQKSFFKKFGYTEAMLSPQIFLEVKPQGIMLRGKLLVSWPERNDIKSMIVERFILSLKENPDIKVLSTWQEKA